MFKKSIPYILLCLLIVSVAIGIAILAQLNAASDDEISSNSVVGTYATGDPSLSADATYLVMETDGSYCIYRQLAEDAVDEGSYKIGPDGKFIMQSEAEGEYDAVAADGCILLAGEGRTIIRFEKFDDVPSYINFSR